MTLYLLAKTMLTPIIQGFWRYTNRIDNNIYTSIRMFTDVEI